MTLTFISFLFFVAVFFMVIAFYMGYATVKESPRMELKKRLRGLALQQTAGLPPGLASDIIREETATEKFFFKFFPVRRLDKLVDMAGLKIGLRGFAVFVLLSAAAGLIIGFLLKRGILLSIGIMLVCSLIPLYYLRARKNSRLQKFTEQFPEALDMISRSLRAGHAFSSAVQLVGSEMSQPLAGFFRTVYEEQTLGLPLRDALSRMLERMPSMDLRLFVAAVNVHKEVGGTLADTLERLAHTVRERIRIRRQVRVYTAQGRISGYILAVLPIFMAAVLHFVMPGYIGELVAVRVGWYVIGIAAAAQIAGFLIIRKMIRIRI